MASDVFPEVAKAMTLQVFESSPPPVPPRYPIVVGCCCGFGEAERNDSLRIRRGEEKSDTAEETQEKRKQMGFMDAMKNVRYSRVVRWRRRF